LDRQRRLFAEVRDALFLVDDHHEAGRRGCGQLLAQERAAEPLDEVEFRIELVGAVDAKVEACNVVQAGERDTPLSASFAVASDVGTPTIASPARTRSPIARTTSAAVRPVPRPTTIFASTSAAARSATAFRISSTVIFLLANAV